MWDFLHRHQQQLPVLKVGVTVAEGPALSLVAACCTFTVRLTWSHHPAQCWPLVKEAHSVLGGPSPWKNTGAEEDERDMRLLKAQHAHSLVLHSSATGTWHNFHEKNFIWIQISWKGNADVPPLYCNFVALCRRMSLHGRGAFIALWNIFSFISGNEGTSTSAHPPR